MATIRRNLLAAIEESTLSSLFVWLVADGW
jgi:hypothetical protein